MNKKLIDWWIGGASYNSYYQAWLTQIVADGGTEPSPSVKTAQNALIRDLDAAGFMSRMKWGYFLHAGDKTTCRRNIKAPSSFRMTEVNTVTFLEGNGCKSDGTSYFNTTYPANAYAGIESDITVALYVAESSTASNGQPYGVRGDASATSLHYLSPGVGGSAGQRLHYVGTATTFSSANHKALYIHTHDGTNSNVYRDGVKDSDAQTPVAPTITAPYFILCRNNSGINGGSTPTGYYTLYVSYVFAFDRFSDSDESTLRGLLNTYKTAVGLP